ncbi:MAG TPA: proline iminopeptidase-family hydrolase [Bacteroidota bacterium]|nr:proline iminopeptidase-family hydrolase [Bacteroidota bacterium]
MKRSFFFFFLASLSLMGCERRVVSPDEGFIDVPGGRVWYRVVGKGHRTPVLLLHGGPGAPSYYLKPLAALGDERPVVFYDQLGCGRSDRPNDSTLWTIQRFIDELAVVRKALNLTEVHILGTSWGTMLAVDYMLTKPQGVRSLILASPALSITRWVRDADILRATLPESSRVAILKHEKDGTTDSPEYQAAMMQYYHLYVSRREPWGPDIDSTFAQLGVGVYTKMCGPSEFTVTGTLKDYDRTDRLRELRLPVLFTAGRYDEARPSTVSYYQSLVPGARIAIFENSAHLTMQDEPEEYVRVVREFLHSVENSP